MKKDNNVLWCSTRESALKAPFIFLNTSWIFDTIEYTRDDWLIYVTSYVIGLAASVYVDTAFIISIINVPIASILFTIAGYAKFFPFFYNLIRRRYEYVVTTTSIVYSFRWLWKTIKSLDLKSISLIVFVKKSGKDTINACFYDENGGKVEFYGFTDYEGLARTLVGAPKQGNEGHQVESGVLSKVWSDVKTHSVEYMNSRGDKVEVTYFINVEELSKSLEKMRAHFKGGEVKFKCAGYEFKFTPTSQ